MVTRSRRLARALTLLAVFALLPMGPAAATSDSPLVTPPGAPAFYQTSSGDSQVKLVWTAPSDNGGQNIQYYVVRYSTTGGDTWITGPTVDDTVKTVKDLTNCLGYVFEVAAYNGSFTGAYSSPSSVLTPHSSGDQSLLQAAAPATVAFNAKARFSAALTDTVDDSPVGDAPVELVLTSNFAHGSSGSGFEIRTDGHGAAGRTPRLQTNTRYHWEYDGSSQHGCASTTPATVTVSQVVHARLSAPHVARHKRIKIYGTVGPRQPGQRVTLQRLESGTWKGTGRAATIRKQNLPTGKKAMAFLITYAPAHKGKETLRVSRAKTRRNAAGVSKRLTLKVR